MTSLKLLLMGVSVAMGSVSVYARPSHLRLNDELTLDRHGTIRMTSAAQSLAPRVAPVRNVAGATKPAESTTDFDAINYADLRNNVKAFADSSAADGGLRINPYCIRSVAELTGEAARITSLDIASMPTRLIGITFGWKF